MAQVHRWPVFHVPGLCRLGHSVSSHICTEGEYCMTSTERHEARYQRRKAARLARKQARCDALGPAEAVFSYRKLYRWGKKCCNNVRWKQSTQNFEAHLFSGTARRRRDFLAGKWRPKKCTHFILHERGKVRPIDAPTSPTGSCKRRSARRCWCLSTPPA